MARSAVTPTWVVTVALLSLLSSSLVAVAAVAPKVMLLARVPVLRVPETAQDTSSCTARVARVQSAVVAPPLAVGQPLATSVMPAGRTTLTLTAVAGPVPRLATATVQFKLPPGATRPAPSARDISRSATGSTDRVMLVVLLASSGSLVLVSSMLTWSSGVRLPTASESML